MQNELRYRVGSREIVDLMAALRNSVLTLSPYFQRNLVWREAHRKDFIDTVLKGYPFPQIFLARGPIDLETMTASQAVVDGQQRLSSIREFVEGKLEVGGKTFKDLSDQEKSEFLKYEVAVIDFDLDAGDARLKDVFHRLNRTYYSLSAIEKLASEYSASEFMLVARTLAGEILKQAPEESELDDIGSEEGNQEPILANVFSRDPGIDDVTWAWLSDRAEGAYTSIIKEQPVFTPFEFDRKVPLMFTLNLMCTYLSGYYERNDKVRKFLDENASDFPEKDEVIRALNDTSTYISSLNLPGNSMWWNKANFFTLASELSRMPALRELDQGVTSERLIEFSQAVPADYALAAKEAIGRKPQREFRGAILRELLLVG